MTLEAPSQELVAKDLHGFEWHFRHTYRGTFYVHDLCLKIILTPYKALLNYNSLFNMSISLIFVFFFYTHSPPLSKKNKEGEYIFTKYKNMSVNRLNLKKY